MPDTPLPTLDIPELPPAGAPCLLFTPAEVARMKHLRATYAWARHGYLDAMVKAARICRPTPAGGGDEWLVNPMPFTDNGRQRENLYAAFCQTLLGYLDDDPAALRRAFETMEFALDEAMNRWWQPASFYITLAVDGFWPALDTDERKRMHALLRRAADVSLASKAKSNVGAGYRKTLVGLGILLRDRDLIREALHDPERGAIPLAANGILADGYWHETAPGYHHYALTQLVETAWLCDRIGVPFKDILDGRIRLGCRASFGLLDARLGYPATGDTHLDRLGCDTLFEPAVALYGDAWCGWALRQGSRSSYVSLALGQAVPPHEPPPADGRLFPASGYAALRTGNPDAFWGSDGLTAYLRFGPHGGWHGHRDNLQLELRAFGCEMVTDSRRAARYRDFEHYGWHRTTLAHSTVVVDRQDQQPAPEAGGRCLHFHAAPRLNAACVEHPAVYPGVVRYRRSMVQTTRCLVDCFEVETKDDRTFHYVLHGAGTYTSPDAGTALDGIGRGNGFDYLARIRGGAIRDPWQATLAQGSWDGHHWKPGSGHSGGGTATGMRVLSTEPMSGRLLLAQAPHGAYHNFEDCLIVETYGRSARFLNVLEPFRDAPAIEIAHALPCQGLFLVEIRRANGRELIFYAPETSGTFTAGPFAFEGRLLTLELDAADKILHAETDETGRLTRNGQPCQGD